MQNEAVTTSATGSNSPPLYDRDHGSTSELSSFYGYDKGVNMQVGYTTAALQLRSSPCNQLHPIVQSSIPPHNQQDFYISPSPPDSSSSGELEGTKELLFRPIDFDKYRTSVPPLTPPDSEGSCVRDSPDAPELPVPHPVIELNLEPTCRSPPPPAHGITVNLLDRDLWKTFMSAGNEMIVTKPGR